MQQIKGKFIGCNHKGDGGLVKWQKHRKNLIVFSKIGMEEWPCNKYPG